MMMSSSMMSVTEEAQVRKAHKLVVNNRKTSLVTGVLDVLSFDPVSYTHLTLPTIA